MLDALQEEVHRLNILASDREQTITDLYLRIDRLKEENTELGEAMKIVKAWNEMSDWLSYQDGLVKVEWVKEAMQEHVK